MNSKENYKSFGNLSNGPADKLFRELPQNRNGEDIKISRVVFKFNLTENYKKKYENSFFQTSAVF